MKQTKIKHPRHKNVTQLNLTKDPTTQPQVNGKTRGVQEKIRGAFANTSLDLHAEHMFLYQIVWFSPTKKSQPHTRRPRCLASLPRLSHITHEPINWVA